MFDGCGRGLGVTWHLQALRGGGSPRCIAAVGNDAAVTRKEHVPAFASVHPVHQSSAVAVKHRSTQFNLQHTTLIPPSSTLYRN